MRSLRSSSPGKPRFSRWVQPQERDAAVVAERESVQRQPTERDISANDECRSCASIVLSRCNRTIQLGCLTKCPFRVVLLRSFAHQASVGNQQVTPGIILQHFDRASHHVAQTRLLAALLDLIEESEFRMGKRTEELGPSESRYPLELGACAHNFETIAPQVEEQIASIISAAALCLGEKSRAATAHGDLDFGCVHKFAGDVLSVGRIGRVRVKRRGRRISQLQIGYKPGHSAARPRNIDKTGKWLSVLV